MPLKLFGVGSNSGCQLAIGHDHDTSTWQPATCLGTTAQRESTAQHDTICHSAALDDICHSVSFPPLGWTVSALSSGANHTMAILAPLRPQHHHSELQIWIAGTGCQGQLGPSQLDRSTPLASFQRLDVSKEILQPLQIPSSYGPKLVACGWNVTYLVLGTAEPGGNDVIVSLGLPKENTFGQLGVANPQPSCVHLVQLDAVLSRLDVRPTHTLSVTSLAAGLRHATAVIELRDSSAATFQSALIGWGAARHAQVGKVSKLAEPVIKSRPGPAAAAIVPTPQVIQSWNSALAASSNSHTLLQAGKDHTVLLALPKDAPTGSMYSFGSNRQFQLLSDELLQQFQVDGQVKSIGCNWSGTVCLVERPNGEQQVYGCGNNTKGQFGTGEFSSSSPTSKTLYQMNLSAISQEQPSHSVRVKKLVSGSEHNVLLIERQQIQHDSNDQVETVYQVWGCGWNEHANLAQQQDNDPTDQPALVRLYPPASAASSLSRPIDLWSGCGTTFVLVDDEPVSSRLNEFVLRLPKIELHAHLNGCIRPSTLRNLVMKATGVDESRSLVQLLTTGARNLSEAFVFFDAIHKSVTSYADIQQIAEQVCYDFENDGVVYAEIRTTPRDLGQGLERYVDAVLAGFANYRNTTTHADSPLMVRLLLSIDRATFTADDAMALIDLATTYRSNGAGVVGIDLSGNPTRGNVSTFLPALSEARCRGLKITIHASEIPNTDVETGRILDFGPDRLGHCSHLSSQLYHRLASLHIPVELCLSSNMITNRLDSFSDHQFSHFFFNNANQNIIALATDDTALCATSLSNEYRIAITSFQISERNAFQLAKNVVNATFLDDSDRVEIINVFDGFEKRWNW